MSEEKERVSEKREEKAESREPSGLGMHNHKLAAEYAHEQGWGTDEEGRTKPSREGENTGSGTDYEYGAQDFGDVPVDEHGVEPAPESVKFITDNEKTGG